MPGASVPWSVFNAKGVQHSDDGSTATLQVAFGEVDWQFLQKVYGWSALQYQAWARGHIDVAGPSVEDVVLYTDNILEFQVDGVPHFGGDFYALRRAPLVLHLEPGRHQLDIRLVRDVRAMGGTGTPEIEAHIELRRATQPLELSEAGILIADAVKGELATSLGSMILRNNGKTTLEVIGVRVKDASLPLEPFPSEQKH